MTILCLVVYQYSEIQIVPKAGTKVSHCDSDRDYVFTYHYKYFILITRILNHARISIYLIYWNRKQKLIVLQT